MTEGLRFSKGHGTENDFVVVPDPDAALDLTPDQVAVLCDRRAGIGGDGVLRVVRSAAVPELTSDTADAAWFMDYRNADGSIAEICGNGLRVFARYLVDQGWAEPGEFRVATRAGTRSVRVAASHDSLVGDVTVDMGVPRLLGGEVSVAVAEAPRRWLPAVNVDVGNPHAVAFVADLDTAGSLRTAPSIRPVAAYPDGVNVEFVRDVRDEVPRHLAMRVHERGSGETRSCGSGACAAMVAAAHRDNAAPGTPYTIDVPGGRLVVVRRGDGHVELTGPAVIVAHGTLDGRWPSP